jgi:hypothetical protein
MTWSETAGRYIASFEAACDADRPGRRIAGARDIPALPDIRVGHLLAMCDSTGLLQHAVHGIPDRAHGYCVDDNARALLFASALGAPGEPRLPEPLTTRFAAFIQHAWNPDTRRFRNFMGYNRAWLEPQGSEDSHGRTLWALGDCALKDVDASRRRWAADLFATALPVVEAFTSPRAWAFTLLGLDAYCTAVPGHPLASRMRIALADRLLARLAAVETDDWAWFEPQLAYDNARLPQALLVAGAATANPRLVAAALRTLRWLMTLQTAPNGVFRPVGTDSFGHRRQPPRLFDQQPVEAAATIAACSAAWAITQAPEWAAEATRAFDWFFGANDLQVALVDRDTGACRDGLHADRANENRGAESVLSYLLGLADIRKLRRLTLNARKDSDAPLVHAIKTRPVASRLKPGGPVVSIPVPEPADLASAPRPGPGRRPAVQTGDRTPGPQSDG